MTDQNDSIEVIKKSIDRERTNLLTVVAALSFLVVCLFVSNIAVGALTLSAVNEREALSIALDDQRLQYYQCIRDEKSTTDCDQTMVSPNSRDIKRDLEGTGFMSVLISESTSPEDDRLAEDGTPSRQAYGVLGYVVHGEFSQFY